MSLRLSIRRPRDAGVATRSPTHRAPTRTLGDAFDPRRNSLALGRLLLAAVVAVTHAFTLGYNDQPYAGRATTWGDLAVDGFFVLSGFLVARSYLTLRSPVRFAWHRFLRIMPAFWVCLVLTALVLAPIAAALDGGSVSSVFRGPDSAQGYLLNNATLMMRQFPIDGVFENTPHSRAIDGALWTLFYEAVCYALIGILGVVGILRHRPALVAIGAGVLWIVTIVQSLGVQVVEQERLLRFTFIFLLGALGWLYRSRIPIRVTWAAASLTLVTAGVLWLDDYRALAGPAFAYLFLWAMVRVPLWYNPPADLSYGLYIWHWPIQQLLVVLGVTAISAPLFAATSVSLALVAAAMSWYAIESPALRLKDLARRSSTPEPSSSGTR